MYTFLSWDVPFLLSDNDYNKYSDVVSILHFNT